MLEKVMQNGAKITKNDAKMLLKWLQNRSKIDPKIDWKIDAKFVVQKIEKIEPWSAKGSQNRVRVSGEGKSQRPQGPYTVRKKHRFDSKTAKT